MQAFIIKLMADWLMIPVVLIAAYTLLFKIPNSRKIKAYSYIIMAGMTSYLLAQFIASFYQPDILRPFQLLGVSAGASFLNNPGFPSDHMLFLTALVCAVWFETRQKNITIILAILSLLVGIGRVLALVHTPIDVVGGIVIGIFGALWYLNDRSMYGKVSPKNVRKSS